MRHAAFPLLLAACAPELPERIRLAPRLHPVTLAGASMTIRAATLEARVVRLRPCPEDPVDLEWPGVPDAVEILPARATPQPWSVGFGDPVDLLRQRARIPAGPWCRLDLVVDGPLRVAGDLEDGRFELEIELPSLAMPFDARFGHVEQGTVRIGKRLTEGFVVHPLVLELGNAAWIGAIVPDLLAGEDVVVDRDDPRHDAILGALVLGAALYRDTSDDARLSQEERDEERVLGLVPIDG